MIADEYKVNERTILRDERLYQGIENIGRKNPGLKRQILSGDLKISKGKIQKLAEMEESRELSGVGDMHSFLEGTPAATKDSSATELTILVKNMKTILQEIARTRDVQHVHALEERLKELRELLS